jgi:peptidoglycan/xylan/chitin deacetylase (PgdA/CDA1 family)
MTRKKRLASIGTTILFFILGVIFLMSSAWLLVDTQKYKDSLAQAQEQLEVAEASKLELETTVESLLRENENILETVKELELEVEELKTQGAEVEETLANDNQKVAYLTFDDGPSGNTIKILDFLKANEIPATFFVLGKEGQGETYRRIVNEGHTLAMHSNTHNYSGIYQSVDTFMADVTALSNTIQKETGVIPHILRFPGGSNNTVSHKYGGKDIMPRIIERVKQAGYIYFDWNVDSMDAAKGLQDVEVIVNSVLNGSKGLKNAVILMHDAQPKTTTVEALPAIVEGLKNQGFVFKALSSDSELVQFY